MAQSTVFEQIIKLISRARFEEIVNRYDADKYTRTLDSWTWFGALLFGQSTGHDSIRAIERVFAHSDNKMAKLGFGPIRKSTLADANRTRQIQVLEDLFHFVFDMAYSISPKKTGFRFKGDIFAMDSTTIELCLSLCPWAHFHHNKGAAKLHTAIDIANDLPQFAVITSGKVHDIKAIKDQLFIPPASTWVFDKGYIDYAWLNEINQMKAFFVTRIKSNCQFYALECRPTNRTRGIMCD